MYILVVGKENYFVLLWLIVINNVNIVLLYYMFLFIFSDLY